MENLYTETQAKELLRQQREIFIKEYDWYYPDEIEERLSFPELPTPIQAIPVERVKEVIKELEHKVNVTKVYVESGCRRFKDEEFIDGCLKGYFDSLNVVKEKLLSDGK